MAKKKINKKRVNSYNRNILVGIFIIVLLFIFAYYFGEYDGRDGEGLGSEGMFDFFDGVMIMMIILKFWREMRDMIIWRG